MATGPSFQVDLKTLAAPDLLGKDPGIDRAISTPAEEASVREEFRPEAAFETLSEGIGRRDLFRAATAIGAGAIAPAWMLSPGVDEVAAQAGGDGPGPRILQSGRGRRPGSYITSTPDAIRWGHLPNRTAKAVRTVRSGSVVTFDTVSHEGILEDQGRDPVAYFARKGVRESNVLDDARAIAASDLEHDFDKDGPHIITGPVNVIGARPGDVLRVDVVGLTPRVSYGVVSNRHGKGALPNEYPLRPSRTPTRAPSARSSTTTSRSSPRCGGSAAEFRGVLPVSQRLRAEFPIDPFMGVMGVALDTAERVNSIPPTPAGGNLDIRDLTVGSRLYLPVFVPGAKFFVGDPHYRQGDGEVALTALEAPLRGTFRLTVLKQGASAIPGGRGTLDMPFGENADFWMPVGLNADLDEAMKQAVREAIEFLHGEHGMSARGRLRVHERGDRLRRQPGRRPHEGRARADLQGALREEARPAVTAPATIRAMPRIWWCSPQPCSDSSPAARTRPSARPRRRRRLRGGGRAAGQAGQAGQGAVEDPRRAPRSCSPAPTSATCSTTRASRRSTSSSSTRRPSRTATTSAPSPGRRSTPKGEPVAGWVCGRTCSERRSAATAAARSRTPASRSTSTRTRSPARSSATTST